MSQEITQCHFDLLAEIVKLNIEAFKIIEDVLKTPEIVSHLAHHLSSSSEANTDITSVKHDNACCLTQFFIKI